MFGLFKRTIIEEWEKTFLSNVFSMLPQFTQYKTQIQEGLLVRVMVDLKDNYVGFTYNPNLSSKFENKKGRSLKIKNIEVYSLISNTYIKAEIYLAFGLVCGYSLNNLKEKIDPSKIKVDNVEIEYLDEDENEIIKSLFNTEEISMINPSDFYEVEINGKIFYHLKDIEDGDFIGIDNNKIIYKITHDPIEIVPINESLMQILKKDKEN